MSKVLTIDALEREKVSDSKCNLVKIENLYRNYFTQVLLTGAEPLQDSFVLRRSQAVF
jgi:hypothetical protein